MTVARYRELRRRRRGHVPVPEPPPVATPPVLYPAVLAGTRLTDAVPLIDDEWGQYGHVLTVRSPDPTVHADVIRAHTATIAAAFGTVTDGVSVAPAGTNMAVTVRVVAAWWLDAQQAARDARMDQVHPWPGPTLDPATGRFAFARSADGSTIHWRLWVPEDGARHGWFIGRSGGGKTGTMGTALLSASTSGLVLPCVIDMQGGASLGAWKAAGVPYADTVDSAVDLLDRLLLEADRRNQWMADGCGRSDRAVQWLPDPTRDVPYILLVVDEAPVLTAHPSGSEKLGKALREWRKLMMGVWVATQGHQSTHAFGWAAGDVARQQIKMGNVCQLNGSVSSMVEALDLVEDASKVGMIPRNQQGGCYFVGPDCPDVTRGRGLYERRLVEAMDSHLRIPSYQLPSAPSAATGAVDLAAAGSCYDAVRLIIAGVEGDGIIRTSETNKALGDRWSPSTISDALQQHARDGHLEKAGRDRWRVVQ